MKIYGSFEKVEKQTDGTIIVMGYVSSEAVDADGEIIRSEAMKAALPEYMKFANIREMHQAKAAGTALEMEVQADGRTWIKAHIVDKDAVLKVDNNVYKGFSIGGRVTERDAEDKKIIKGIKLSEISLVDRPANPEAVFSIGKVEGVEDEAKTDEPATKMEQKTDSVNTTAISAVPSVAAVAAAVVGTVAMSNADAGNIQGGGVPVGDVGGVGKESAETASDLKKGMWAIGTFASILSSIESLQASAEWEAANEKDGSTMPAELMAWLKQGGALLSAMVTEEVAEMVKDDTIIVDVISLADRAKGLIKAAWSEEESAKFAKGLDALILKRKDVLAKAGARNSKADQKHIDAIHSAALALGADCGMNDKAEGAGDLAKLAQENEDLKKANIELVEVSEAFAAKIKVLEELPKPSKAVLKAISKGDDTATPEKETVDEEKPKDGVSALKKVWSTGGKAA